jgi:hypothetical protein
VVATLEALGQRRLSMPRPEGLAQRPVGDDR